MPKVTTHLNGRMIAIIIVGVVGAHASGIMPAIVGTLARHGGLILSEAGLIASFELLGMTLGMVIMAVFLNSSQPKRIAFLGALLFLAMNLLSVRTNAFYDFCAVRFAAGIGAGFLFGAMSKTLALSASPERLFGIFYGVQICSSFLAYQLWGSLENLGGTQGPFLWLSFLALLAIISSLFVSGGESSSQDNNVDERPNLAIRLGAFALITMFVFNASIMGMWSYAVAIGDAKELDSQDINNALSFTAISGLTGAITTTFLGPILKHRLAVLIFVSTLSISITLLYLSSSAMLYGLALSILMFSWIAVNPFIMGIFARIDQGGRLVTLSVASMYGGLSAGPALMAFILRHSDSRFDYVTFTSLALLVLSALAFIIISGVSENERSVAHD